MQGVKPRVQMRLHHGPTFLTNLEFIRKTAAGKCRADHTVAMAEISRYVCTS